jgi:hypothetical protein
VKSQIANFKYKIYADIIEYGIKPYLSDFDSVVKAILLFYG